MGISADNFGFLIAYLIPGFVCLWALHPYVETIGRWLKGPVASAPTVGGFLFATLASITAGLLVSAVRWCVIDRVHRLTGIGEPRLDFSRLSAHLPGFQALVEYHYRYYQFYANTFVAVAVLYAARFPSLAPGTTRGNWLLGAFLFTEAILFLASRDTLRKYYRRSEGVLGTPKGKRTFTD